MRILIIGGPKTGKSTMGAAIARKYGVELQSTDSVIDLGWSAASAEVARWMAKPGPWVIEGVAGARACRKLMAAIPGHKPCDLILVADHPFVALSAGQQAMAKGCATVWNEIRAEVLRRGVKVDDLRAVAA